MAGQRRSKRPATPSVGERGTQVPHDITGDTISSEVMRAEALTVLRSVMNDPETPAAARGAAARTVLEVMGAIGRHAVPPPVTSDKPLATMTRAEIDAELARLKRSSP